MSHTIYELSTQGGSVASLCSAVGLPRAQFYRHLNAPEPAKTDTALRERIQQVALDWSCYGYRRVTKELHRQGIPANHKWVLRLINSGSPI